MSEKEFVRPELTKRQALAIANGRLTLEKLYHQKGWPLPKRRGLFR